MPIEYFDMLYFENCTLINGIENNNENKKILEKHKTYIVLHFFPLIFYLLSIRWI